MFLCKKLCKNLIKKKSNTCTVIVARTKGNRGKRYVRLINRNFFFWGLPAIIIGFLRNVSSNGFLSFVCYVNGLLCFYVATFGEYSNQLILNGYFPGVYNGATTYLVNVPRGGSLHSIESCPGSGAKYARSAGAFGTVLSNNKTQAVLKLRSKMKINVSSSSIVFLGQVSNITAKLSYRLKAGSSIYANFRPIVRGIARNPVDHPNGGRTPGGKIYRTLWGALAKGFKTSKYNKKITNIYTKILN